MTRTSPDAQPIFTVFISVDSAVEQDWNNWYDECHVPEVMAASEGIESATRYLLNEGNVPHRYLAVYRFRDASSLDAFMASDALAAMGRAYDAQWGHVSARMRGAYSPILHVERKR